MLGICKNMSNDETSRPSKLDSNYKTYHEQVNKTPPYKMKGGESKTNYYPVNKFKPSYGAIETTGTFSTTANKRPEVPCHTNYNSMTGARPIKICAFFSELHNPVHCGSYKGL